MRAYRVVFAPEAEDDLAGLYRYICEQGAPANAAGYVEAILDSCDGLATFPHRGHPRDDIRPGLRMTHHRGRSVIAYTVDDEAGLVSILRVFYGGRNYEGALADDDMGSRH